MTKGYGMSIRAVTASLLAVLAAQPALSEEQKSADAGIAPFSAHYLADWKSINVGTSDLELKHGSEPGHYVYTWTITARGIFRIAYSDALTQTSWFNIVDDHVRPLKYQGVQGSSRLTLDFDWQNARAKGVADNKPIDLVLKEGTQDVMSIQVEVMLDLKNGRLPPTFQIIEKDESKDFVYTQEGSAKLRTDIGLLDTLIVSSHRTGSNRILRMWFAPALGFVPVQAERTRDGKLEFAMRIKTLQR
jgi:Protein of unknown function (DUF3108)